MIAKGKGLEIFKKGFNPFGAGPIGKFLGGIFSLIVPIGSGIIIFILPDWSKSTMIIGSVLVAINILFIKAPFLDTILDIVLVCLLIYKYFMYRSFRRASGLDALDKQTTIRKEKRKIEKETKTNNDLDWK